MWEDVAVAVACVGFLVAFAVVALELWTIGRAGELTGHAGVDHGPAYRHADHAPVGTTHTL